jgi:tetratricopeptide (TPR) repeat protein
LSVRQLAELMMAGEYRRCLQRATHMLDEERPLHEVAQIQAMICRSSLELTDYFAAVSAGVLALALAEEAGDPDMLGSVLVDLGTALSRIRRYGQALSAFDRFLQGLPDYTVAQRFEGTVLERMAETLLADGRAAEALARYSQARAWFIGQGDREAALRCSRAMLGICLESGQVERARAYLEEGERYLAECPTDSRFLSDHLLDRALYHSLTGQVGESIRDAFLALEAAEDRLDQQCRAHLLLARNAMAEGRPVDAVIFVLAARVSAIDGRLYQLEFEATELLIRLLDQGGPELLALVDEEYSRNGVDIYHYLPAGLKKRWESH